MKLPPTPRGFTRDTVMVPQVDGGEVCFDGFRYGPLLVHRCWGNRDNWDVMHIQSSCRVPVIDLDFDGVCFDVACRFAQAMAGAIEWDKITLRGEKVVGWTAERNKKADAARAEFIQSESSRLSTAKVAS